MSGAVPKIAPRNSLPTTVRLKTVASPAHVALPPAIASTYCTDGAPLFANRFQLQRLLGYGGMGSVFRGEDTITGETVAVKITDERMGECLRQEGEAIRRFSSASSPHLVAFRNEGEGEAVSGVNTRYLALEYVDGRTVEDEIAGTNLSLSRALDIASQICYGLETAAERGIPHRDLKPGNVMLRYSDDTAVVFDFGLALFEPHEGCTIGTPLYMSPEQAQGDFAVMDHRSDIYSLGLMLYEMITRRKPFEGGSTPLELTAKKTQEGLPNIPGLHPSVQELLNKMTAVQVEERHETLAELQVHIGEVRQELEALANSATVVARIAAELSPSVRDSSPSILIDLNRLLAEMGEDAPTALEMAPPTVLEEAHPAIA